MNAPSNPSLHRTPASLLSSLQRGSRPAPVSSNSFGDRNPQRGAQVGFPDADARANRSFWFFFYSNEGAEPSHVHAQQERKMAKFWLNPVALASAGRFSAFELRAIE